jgi:hemolysin activation/secretion protein
MGASAPLDARYTLPGWERDVTVLGGADSHRSFVPGRFVGTGLVLGSVEVRHNLLDLGGLGAVTLIAFLDAGRVFGPKDFQWTAKGWKVGGGGGVAIRVLQSAPLLLNFAGGPDGFRFTMGNGWSF